MISGIPTSAAAGATPGAGRAFPQVGPFIGATSLPAGTGIVFVSADGTWLDRAS